VAVVAEVRFSEAMRRQRVARTKTDMRWLSVALEGYLVDRSTYPAWGIGHEGPGRIRTFNWDVAQRTGNRSGVADLRSFLLSDPSIPQGRFGTLQDRDLRVEKGVLVAGSPYMASYPADRFCSDRGATYVYWSVFPGQRQPDGTIAGRDAAVSGLGFILVSSGPDGKYTLPGSYPIYNPAITQPSPLLLGGTNDKGIAFTYDPTNGMTSDGDIWRVKM